MIINYNYLFFVWFVLLTGSFIACKESTDPEQEVRLQQLAEFAAEENLDLSQYDYVLVEGRVKCKGCVQIWPDRISKEPIVEASVLFICGDMDTYRLFGLKNSDVFVVNLDSIEYAFPYIANYFLFYRSDGQFDKYIELGARNTPIPGSIR